MSAELGVRERKKQAAHTALSDAALTLFEQKGFDATTVNQIAERAGMSPRTFFRYFDTKEDVLFQVAPTHLEELRSLLRSRPSSESNAVALRAALLSFSELLETERKEIQLRTQLARAARTVAERGAIELQRWRIVLADELERRSGGGDSTRCHLLAGAGVHVLTVAISLWPSEDHPLPQLTEQCYGQLAEVVCSG